MQIAISIGWHRLASDVDIVGSGKGTQPVPISSKMLEKMRANPSNWKIDQVETLCQQVGLECRPARGGGSHFKVFGARLNGILTIPAKRPIKAVYIKRLVALADAHIAESMRLAEQTR